MVIGVMGVVVKRYQRLLTELKKKWFDTFLKVTPRLFK
jgi:hypothetical protein